MRTKIHDGSERRQASEAFSALTINNKKLGCFIGLAIGDAVGAPNEFKVRDKNVIHDMQDGGFNGLLKAGMWTDDTSMALCLAESMIDHNGYINDADLMNRWRKWMHKGHNSSMPGRPAFDVGFGTRRMLSTRSSGERTRLARDNSGNGGIMRLAPSMLWPHGYLTTHHIATAQAKLTHASDDAKLCAEELVNDLYVALTRSEKPDWFIIDGDKRELPLGLIKRSDVSSSGHCIDTLNAARWCVYHTTTFEHAILAAANLGDDADSVAAVAGQIAGALYGYEAIPDKWLKKLYDLPRLLDIAHKLINGGK